MRVKKPSPFIIPFLLFGFGFFFYNSVYVPWKRKGAVSKWKKTDCQIIKSEIHVYKSKRTSVSDSYEFLVSYQYNVSKKLFYGSSFSPVTEITPNRSKILGLTKKFPAGRKTFCFVNPDKPDQSFLRVE